MELIHKLKKWFLSETKASNKKSRIPKKKKIEKKLKTQEIGLTYKNILKVKIRMKLDNWRYWFIQQA